MMSIDFYGEILKVVKPKNYQELKTVIAKEFSIEKDELDGLIIVFENNNKSKELVTEKTFNCLIAKSNAFVFVSVSENSKLFQCVKNEKNNIIPQEEKKTNFNRNNLDIKLAVLKNSIENEKKKHDELALQQDRQDRVYQNLEKVIERIVDNKFTEVKKGIIEGTLMEASKVSFLMNNSNNPQPSSSLLSITNRSICNSEHLGIQCKGCTAFPIKGLRFMCTICNSFDFCEKCEEKQGLNHQHPFLKVRFPLN